MSEETKEDDSVSTQDIAVDSPLLTWTVPDWYMERLQKNAVPFSWKDFDEEYLRNTGQLTSVEETESLPLRDDFQSSQQLSLRDEHISSQQEEEDVEDEEDDEENSYEEEVSEDNEDSEEDENNSEEEEEEVNEDGEEDDEEEYDEDDVDEEYDSEEDYYESDHEIQTDKSYSFFKALVGAMFIAGIGLVHHCAIKEPILCKEFVEEKLQFVLN